MTPSSLSLYEFFRYIFCGVILGCSFIFSKSSFDGFTSFVSSGDGIAAFTLVAFIVGAVFYSIYRAVFYPLLGRFTLLLTFCYLGKHLPIRAAHFSPHWIPPSEFERDCHRWSEGMKTKSGTSRMDEWASQVHLIYTSGLAIWIGSFLGTYDAVDGRFSQIGVDWRLVVVCLFCFLSAFISDLRRRYVEEQYLRLSVQALPPDPHRVTVTINKP